MKEGVRTVSVDEMTGIQALERVTPAVPVKLGQVERWDSEYIHHGTQTVIASFDVATGRVCGTLGAHRNLGDRFQLLDAPTVPYFPDLISQRSALP